MTERRSRFRTSGGGAEEKKTGAEEKERSRFWHIGRASVAVGPQPSLPVLTVLRLDLTPRGG
ncbi:hypothetical protein BH10ACI2_BH10ACI2_03640 [soil metagenome]